MADPVQAVATDLVIPPELLAKFPELLGLIQQSESMNTGERQYWINILPVMTPEQVQSLRDILENERKQLTAIDEKYSKAMQDVGQARAIEEISMEREAKMQQRHTKEAAQKSQEEQATEELLKTIEGQS